MGYPSHGMGSFQASSYIGDRQRGFPQKTSGEVADAEMSGEFASSKNQQHWDQYWDELEDLYGEAAVDDAFYLDEQDLFGDSFPRDILIPSPPRRQNQPSFHGHQIPVVLESQNSEQVPQETNAQAQPLNTVVPSTYAAKVKGTATQPAASVLEDLFDDSQDSDEDEDFSEQNVDEDVETSDLDDHPEETSENYHEFEKFDNPNHDYNGEDIEVEDVTALWAHKCVPLRPRW